MNIIEISPQHLVAAIENARRTPADQERDDELKASIAANGVLQNLVVTQSGNSEKYNVVAGSRRLQAVNELIDAGELDSEIRIPCRVLGHSEQAAEASIAENTCRAPMHELDELEAYGRLIDEYGYSPDQVARHFGRPLRDVQSTLALYKVHPDIREACRKGIVDVDDLSGFAITTDQERQLSVFKRLKKAGRLYAFTIKQELRDNTVRSDSSLARFVGVENYIKAGGRISEDMFGENVMLLQPNILGKLADEKIERAKAKLGDGWAWIEVKQDYDDHDFKFEGFKQKKGNLDKVPEKLKTKIADLEEKLATGDDLPDVEKELKKAKQSAERHRDYSAAEKAVSGCILTVKGGRLRTWKAAYIPAKKKKKQDQGAGGSADLGYSQAVKGELSGAKHHVAQLAIAEHITLGAELAMFSFVGAWIELGFFERILSIQITREGTSADPLASDTAAEELDALSDNDDYACTDWFDDRASTIENFQSWIALEDSEKQKLLALAAAHTLCDERYDHPRGALDFILESTGKKIAHYWRPTADNYFGRIKKDLCLQHGAEIFEDEAWPEANKRKSRAELAAILEDKVKTMPADLCWLPPMSPRDEEQES